MFKHPNFSIKKAFRFGKTFDFLSSINIIPYGYGLFPIMTEIICICIVFITNTNLMIFILNIT